MTSLLLLSGGVGTRMGLNVPKQYLEFRGNPIIGYSLSAFNRHPLINQIIIVADEKWHCEINSILDKLEINKFVSYANPGETRQYSIINGLEQINKLGGADHVIIHDAVRPLVSSELITSCLENLNGCDGVMPVLPAKDTFYLLDNDGFASKLLPRPLLAAGQAPEAFNFNKYYEANMSLSREELLKINGSSELALYCGLKVKTISGDERNIKITTPNDLKLLDAYMEH